MRRHPEHVGRRPARRGHGGRQRVGDEIGSALPETGHDRLVLLRLEGAGRVDEDPARAGPARRRRRESPPARGPASRSRRAGVATCRRGCAGGRRGSSTARRRARASHVGPSAPASARASATRDSTIVAPSRAHAVRRSSSRAAFGSAARTRPRLPMSAARCEVLVPGAAQTSTTVSPGSGPSAWPTRMAASSWTTANPSWRGASRRRSPARSRARPSGANRVGVAPTSAARKAAATSSGVARSVLVRTTTGGASFMASASASASSAPSASTTARRAMSGETSGGRGPRRGPRPSARATAAARARAPGGRRSRSAVAPGPPLLGELHRLVDRGPRRDPVEERELVRREPEERPHPRGELVERTPRRASEHPVEPALPAERAEHELRGEAAIARLEVGPVAERLEQPVAPTRSWSRSGREPRAPRRAPTPARAGRESRRAAARPARRRCGPGQAPADRRAKQRSRREPRPPEIGLPRHRTPVLGLDLDRLEKTRSRPDGEPAFGGREDAGLPAPGDGPRAPDQEPSARHERGRARPRIQSADAGDEARGRLRPVEQPVLLAEPRRERRGAGVLRARREGVQTVQRVEEHLGAERGQARRRARRPSLRRRSGSPAGGASGPCPSRDPSGRW